MLSEDGFEAMDPWASLLRPAAAFPCHPALLYYRLKEAMTFWRRTTRTLLRPVNRAHTNLRFVTDGNLHSVCVGISTQCVLSRVSTSEVEIIPI